MKRVCLVSAVVERPLVRARDCRCLSVRRRGCLLVVCQRTRLFVGCLSGDEVVCWLLVRGRGCWLLVRGRGCLLVACQETRLFVGCLSEGLLASGICWLLVRDEVVGCLSEGVACQWDLLVACQETRLLVGCLSVGVAYQRTRLLVACQMARLFVGCLSGDEVVCCLLGSGSCLSGDEGTVGFLSVVVVGFLTRDEETSVSM